MRFAKIGERAIARQGELSGEEWRLYCLMKFHTWNDSGICNKNLRELATLYRLAYNHTTERYKSLRKKGWCKNTPKGILLLDLETPKIGVLATPEIGVSNGEKLQKSELPTPEIGVSNGEKLQKSEFVYKESLEPFKTEFCLDDTTTEPIPAAEKNNAENVVVGVVENKGLSKLSIEECLAYVELCEKDGQTVKNRYGLAIHLFETGEADALMTARLYPQQTVERTIEYDDALDERAFDEALRGLLEMQSEGFDTGDIEKFYTPREWARLTEEAKNYE